MADPMITPAPVPPPFLRLRARQSAAGSITDQCSLCTTTANSLAKCTSDYDPICTCSGTLFASLLTSCMSSQSSLGCVSSDFTDASSTISATCRYWTSSLASSICQSCATLAATQVTCADRSDYPCLCRSPPTTAPYLLALNSCAGHPYTSLGATLSCAFSSQNALTESLASSCSSYSSSTSAYPPGCPACQAQAADSASCSGKLDWACLCTAGASYLPALSSCINIGSCPNTDYTIAQSTYTSACAVVKAGGTPIISSPAANTGGPAQTGTSSSSGGTTPKKVSGPGIALIAGAVAGVLLLLALICVGGFLILRRRKSSKPPSASGIPLQPTPPGGAPPEYKDGGDAHYGPQEVDGLAVPGHPGQGQGHVPFSKPQQQQQQGPGMWPPPAGYAEAPSPSVSPAPGGGWGQPQQQGVYFPPPPQPQPPRQVDGYVEMGGDGEAERRRRAGLGGGGGKAYFELPGH